MFPLLLSTVVSCVCKYILHVTYTPLQQKFFKPLSWVWQHHCKWYCIERICKDGLHVLNIYFIICFKCKKKKSCHVMTLDPSPTRGRIQRHRWCLLSQVHVYSQFSCILKIDKPSIDIFTQPTGNFQFAQNPFCRLHCDIKMS